jgi:hypothetical protein
VENRDAIDLASLATPVPLSSDDVGHVLSLAEHLDRDIPFGPLDESTWDELLDELALDTSRSNREPKQGR